VSCKELTKNKNYVVTKFEKFESKFGGEKMIATLQDGEIKMKVFLPSRISADDFTDTDLDDYNNNEPNVFLVFKGMHGRAINVDFVPMK
jgi:hypothetical protein